MQPMRKKSQRLCKGVRHAVMCTHDVRLDLAYM